jgi:asparagine synthase (glutamine-hydrolysing)
VCGLVALLSSGPPADAGALRRALDALQHRGPDGRGVWMSPDRRVALGHARLAVVDPASGAQPIAGEDGAVVAAVNGEIYDDDRLRRDLERRGHRFRSRSDSELVVHLYEEHGLDLFPRLRGEFAFALWDGRARRLVAARDRFGAKPLVWHEGPGGLALASEAKALFALGRPAAWDEDSVFHALSLQYVLPDRTLFRDVRTLRPGHVLVADARGARISPYWDLDYPRRAAPADAPGLAAELRERLDEAVRLRLRADVPVGALLSGGLDSSAVAALAGPRLAGVFTVGFDAPPYDESEVARRSAARLGLPHHEVRVDAPRLLGALPEAVERAEGLAVNGHLPAKFLLSRAVRDAGVRVLLTGEGADEIFAGYPHLREEARDPADLLTRGIMLPDGPGLPLDAVRARLGRVPRFLEAKASLGARLHRLLDPGFLERFRGRDPYAEFLGAFDVPGRLEGRDPLHQALYLWIKSALAVYILRTLGDGTEMAHGVEGRLPFLDTPLVEFAGRIPPDLQIRDGREKHLLREAVRPLVTEEVAARRKQPFFAPPLGAAAADALRAASLPGFFARDAIRGDVDDPCAWTMLSAAALQERFRL